MSTTHTIKCSSIPRSCPTAPPCCLPTGHAGKCSSGPHNRDAAALDWWDEGLHIRSTDLLYLIEEFETPEDVLAARDLERSIEQMRPYREQIVRQGL